jgi:carbon starvation protein CstA
MKRPPGFPVLAFVLANVVYLRVLELLLGRPPWVGTGPGIVALNLLLVPLLAIAAEALWRVRPWCVTAITWTAVVALPLFVAGVADHFRRDSFGAVVFIVLFLVILVAVVSYVQKQAEALFGAAVPRPAHGAAVRRRISVVPPQRP